MTICIPWAHGVPAAGGPPVWWDTTSGSEPDFNRRVDDPRWQGSFASTFPDSGNGSPSEHAIFRSLHHEEGGRNYLYLSWWIQVDPNFAEGVDRISLGLREQASNTAFVFRVPAYSTVPSTSQQAVALPTGQAQQVTKSPAGTWSTAAWGGGDLPTWVRQWGRAWINRSNNSWAVHLRVPMTAAPAPGLDNDGIRLGTSFKLWYEIRVSAGSTAGNVYHKYPRSAPISTTTNIPNPDTWADFQIGGGPQTPGCEAGVWISPLDVGTTNVDDRGLPAPNTIKWSRTDSTVKNTFFARPHNATRATIPAGAAGIHARFRLAAWGSQPDWNQVTDPSTLWRDILPGGGDVLAAASTAPGTQAEITFDWPMTTSTSPSIDEFDPPGPTKLRPHQCMLVELSGAGVDFGRSSVYRNMDVARASVFERDAEISVKGLGSMNGQAEQDTYLFVQTLNMPEVVDQPDQGGREVEPQPDLSMVATHVPKSPQKEMAQQIVHVYHATGEMAEDDDGNPVKVLRPQTSFGVYVHHEGPLFGWQHELQGDLEEIGPSFYRLRVPTDGSVMITQRVEAFEELPESCLGWLLRRVRKLFGG